MKLLPLSLSSLVQSNLTGLLVRLMKIAVIVNNCFAKMLVSLFIIIYHQCICSVTVLRFFNKTTLILFIEISRL